MSRINAIRIVNLNYNNNAIHVDDEIFELGTESTLFSLRNGGGKSVLVQMMSAPFVRKRYRDTKDRLFESYFTSNRPTYILVEWTLDGGAGFVLTGMMVKKAAENRDDENQDPLDTVQFVYEYQARNEYDIYQFPCVKEEADGKKLLGFGQAKQLMEELKRDPGYQFNYYDMNLPNQFRNYFEKLKEYGINHKEWESIIKKINLKESGLSELFAEAKDEAGLVDKWFLPAVEDKLSKEENRIDKFVELIQKYILQYRENQANFAKKDTIDLFKEETKELLSIAMDYQQKQKEQMECENQIANLIASLKHIIENLSLQSKEINFAMDQLNREMNQIECSEIAYDIYLKTDAFQEQSALLKECERLMASIAKEQEELNGKIHRYECSKVHQTYQEAEQEIKATEAKLDIMRRQDADLAPERNNLGYSIRSFYETQRKEMSDAIKEQEEALAAVLSEQEECAVTAEQYNGTIAKYSEENGTLKSNIKAYGQSEMEFNARYKEDLTRNIVGFYEEEYLDGKKRQMQEEQEASEERKKEVMRQSDEISQKLVETRDHRNTLQMQTANEKSRRLNLLMKQEELQRLIAERKTILPYVELSEEELFETAKILDAFDRKIAQLGEMQRHCVVLEDEKRKELEQLKSGKVMELPKEIEEQLNHLEVHYLYGTQWLKKNGKTQEENFKLVSANPFLPYAIILGASDFDCLKKVDLGIHTSFPIPIVRREDLEKETTINDSKVYEYSEVSFYVSFNHNLLDKNGLEQLIRQKTEELDECRVLLEQTVAQIQHYDDKKNVILYQKLSKEDVKQCDRDLTQCEKRLNELNADIIACSESIDVLEKEQLILVKTAESIAHSIGVMKEKQESYERILLQYEQYKKDQERSVYLTEEIKQLKASIEQMKLSSVRMKRKEQEVRLEKERLVVLVKGLEEKSKAYESFESGQLLEQSIEEMEARFIAITTDLHHQEDQLTERLAAAKKRSRESHHELQMMMKEYQLQETDYQELNYSMELMMALKKSYQEYEEKKKDAAKDQLKLTGDMSSLRTTIYARKAEYEKKSGGRPMPEREALTLIDFKEALHTKYLERQAKEKEQTGITTKLNGCQNALNSLAEYEELTVTQPLELRFTISELNQIRNEMLKNYRTIKEEVNKYVTQVIQETGRLLRIPEFADDYYHKPLESLERLVDTPEVLIEQLGTTIQAYDHLLEKLTIDLMMIEQEGEKVLEVLLQFVQEVHENLGKIDRNSTIRIRERDIKMLKIQLPNWEEERRTYSLRCKDYLDHLVVRALELLEENKNIEELVSSQITTKKLYHSIVGVGNIGIHLYKIEEEREYPITWAEVSKNSGGEGFLSAFVILSSLLSYMRRDDTDIFQNKDSGKVLIMDNPFAQTNAAHLLKPLMDIAKKSNTQLICLSGLGGESIYNRFDNIYVLNLVSSKIKDSMQYLHGDHIKGEDLESIVSARIKIEEEQMVLF